MNRKSFQFAGWIRLAALTVAIAFGFSTAPLAMTGLFGLESGTALAKSDKGKSDGKSKKSKGSSSGGSKSADGGSGASGSDGSSGKARGRSGTLTFGSDGRQIKSTGKRRSYGSPQGGGDWSSVAVQGRNAGKGKERTNGPLDTAAEDDGGEVEQAKLPSAPVRAYTKYYGLNQGEVASLLRSWNGMNGLQGNLEGKLARMEDNPNSLHSAQLAYFRDSMAAGDALGAFVGLGGDPDDAPDEAGLAAASAALDPDALAAAQQYLDAQAQLASPEGLAEDEIAALTDVIANYTGEDPEAVVAMAESGEAESVIAQYDAWNDYQTAETAAGDSFLAASRSYGEDIDEATLGQMRELVDAIAEMSGMAQDVADDSQPGSDDGAGGEDGAAN